MDVKSCRRAVEIADHLSRLSRLQKIVESAGDWRLEMCALDGDEEGGTQKFSTILPREFCAAAVQPVMKMLADELQSLGVTADSNK